MFLFYVKALFAMSQYFLKAIIFAKFSFGTQSILSFRLQKFLIIPSTSVLPSAITESGDPMLLSKDISVLGINLETTRK